MRKMAWATSEGARRRRESSWGHREDEYIHYERNTTEAINLLVQNRHHLVGHVFDEMAVDQFLRHGIDEIDHTAPFLLVELDQTEIPLVLTSHSISYGILFVFGEDDCRVIAQHVVVLHVIASSRDHRIGPQDLLLQPTEHRPRLEEDGKRRHFVTEQIGVDVVLRGIEGVQTSMSRGVELPSLASPAITYRYCCEKRCTQSRTSFSVVSTNSAGVSTDGANWRQNTNSMVCGRKRRWENSIPSFSTERCGIASSPCSISGVSPPTPWMTSANTALHATSLHVPLSLSVQ